MKTVAGLLLGIHSDIKLLARTSREERMDYKIQVSTGRRRVFRASARAGGPGFKKWAGPGSPARGAHGFGVPAQQGPVVRRKQVIRLRALKLVLAKHKVLTFRPAIGALLIAAGLLAFARSNKPAQPRLRLSRSK